MTYTYCVQFYEGSHMPRGIYNRKGRKSKAGRKVWPVGREMKAALRAMGEEPKRDVYVIEIRQARRIMVYAKANDVGEAAQMAQVFVHGNKKLSGRIIIPGAQSDVSDGKVTGAGIVHAFMDQESDSAKAFLSPIQRVYKKSRSNPQRDSVPYSDVPYKIVSVRG